MNESICCIRRATRADVSAIVQLQMACLPHFYLADPGSVFLRNFYSFVLRDSHGLLFVSECNRKLAGFAAGFFASPHFHEKIALPRLHILTTASICLVSNPIRLPKFFIDLHRTRHLQYLPGNCDETSCELVTLAIEPRLRMQGHGKSLISALVDAASQNKMTQLNVHLRSSDNGMGEFYRRLGFTLLRTFKMFEPSWTDEYVLPIQKK